MNTSAQTIPAWVYEQPARAYQLLQDVRQENKGFRSTANQDAERLVRANQARIAALPTGFYSLIPSGYDARNLADWLDTNASRLK